MIERVRFSFLGLTPERNAALVAQSDEERAALPGSSLGCMRGGWSSLKQPAIAWSEEMLFLGKEFVQRCPYGALGKSMVNERRVIPEQSVWAWHVQLDQDDKIDWHDHHQALWSGVYYPAVGPLPSTLWLADGAQSVGIQVTQGLLVTFPPTLQHKVEYPLVNAGKQTRYSISFNLHPAGQSGA